MNIKIICLSTTGTILLRKKSSHVAYCMVMETRRFDANRAREHHWKNYFMTNIVLLIGIL